MSDGISAFLRLLTGALGAGHPIRLSCGVSLGLLSKIVISLLAKLYPDHLLWSTLNEYAATWYVLIIVPLLFAPLIFGRRGALEASIQQINTVKLLVEVGNFSATEKRQFWRLLVEKYIKGLQPNLSRSPSIKRLADETVSDLRDGN